MKKLIILFFLYSNFLTGQENNIIDDKVYYLTEVDIKPEFQNGLPAFYRFIDQNLSNPIDSLYHGKKLITTFVISKEGIIKDVNIYRGLGFGTDDELKRVFESSPKWIPAKLKDEFVSVSYSLPYIFPKPMKQFNAPNFDKKASFPGGIEKFHSFIQKNFKFTREFVPTGKVFITFMINKRGQIENIKFLSDLKFGTAEEIKRVLQISPFWFPAEKDGQPVNSMLSMPINFEHR